MAWRCNPNFRDKTWWNIWVCLPYCESPLPILSRLHLCRMCNTKYTYLQATDRLIILQHKERYSAMWGDWQHCIFFMSREKRRKMYSHGLLLYLMMQEECEGIIINHRMCHSLSISLSLITLSIILCTHQPSQRVLARQHRMPGCLPWVTGMTRAKEWMV